MAYHFLLSSNITQKHQNIFKTFNFNRSPCVEYRLFSHLFSLWGHFVQPQWWRFPFSHLLLLSLPTRWQQTNGQWRAILRTAFRLSQRPFLLLSTNSLYDVAKSLSSLATHKVKVPPLPRRMFVFEQNNCILCDVRTLSCCNLNIFCSHLDCVWH